VTVDVSKNVLSIGQTFFFFRSPSKLFFKDVRTIKVFPNTTIADVCAY